MSVGWEATPLRLCILCAHSKHVTVMGSWGCIHRLTGTNTRGMHSNAQPSQIIASHLWPPRLEVQKNVGVGSPQNALLFCMIFSDFCSSISFINASLSAIWNCESAGFWAISPSSFKHVIISFLGMNWWLFCWFCCLILEGFSVVWSLLIAMQHLLQLLTTTVCDISNTRRTVEDRRCWSKACVTSGSATTIAGRTC